jgi:hypothetical protein
MTCAFLIFSYQEGTHTNMFSFDAIIRCIPPPPIEHGAGYTASEAHRTAIVEVEI